PQDAGRFITLPCVVTRDPRTGKRNVGMYRMQVYDERTTGMHWQRQKVAAEHYRELLRRGAAGSDDAARNPAAVDIMARTLGGAVAAQPRGGAISAQQSSLGGSPPPPTGRMDVAVAIGTDPALTFSAIVPAPPDVE